MDHVIVGTFLSIYAILLLKFKINVSHHQMTIVAIAFIIDQVVIGRNGWLPSSIAFALLELVARRERPDATMTPLPSSAPQALTTHFNIGIRTHKFLALSIICKLLYTADMHLKTYTPVDAIHSHFTMKKITLAAMRAFDGHILAVRG